jgi:hypothetical protein
MMISPVSVAPIPQLWDRGSRSSVAAIYDRRDRSATARRRYSNGQDCREGKPRFAAGSLKRCLLAGASP